MARSFNRANEDLPRMISSARHSTHLFARPCLKKRASTRRFGPTTETVRAGGMPGAPRESKDGRRDRSGVPYDRIQGGS
jgi:hypothetical protein